MRGYGLQFYLNRYTQATMQGLVRELKKMGVPLRLGRDEKTGVAYWIGKLFRPGIAPAPETEIKPSHREAVNVPPLPKQKDAA